MSCHGMSAWVVFWLGHLAISDRKSLQVCFHDDIDGSSLARAIYASTGPLLFPLIQGFSHTHTILQKKQRVLGKSGLSDFEENPTGIIYSAGQSLRTSNVFQNFGLPPLEHPETPHT